MEKDTSEERSNSPTSVDASDTNEEINTSGGIKEDETGNVAVNVINETRERFCLKTEPNQSTDIALHSVLSAEWMNRMRKGLYEGEKEDDKKREEEESKLREEIMKKFPRSLASRSS